MSETIYASFVDPLEAKKAVGALLDNGVLKDDISLVVSEAYATSNPHYLTDVATPGADGHNNTERAAMQGVTTTTAADAGAGAAKGAGIGAVLGILGALASLVIPGFGLVIGGGALATAIAAAAGTAAAGAIAGGVTGYLKDQGVPEDHAKVYEQALHQGGAMVAVQSPSGTADRTVIETMLAKYGATNAKAYAYAPRTTTTVIRS